MSEFPSQYDNTEQNKAEDAEKLRAREARGIIGKIVMYHPNKVVEHDTGLKLDHMVVNDVPVEDGNTIMAIWLPPEEQDYSKLNHDVAWSAGVSFKDANEQAYTGLFFVTPNDQIVDGDLAMLSPEDSEKFVERNEKHWDRIGDTWHQLKLHQGFSNRDFLFPIEIVF